MKIKPQPRFVKRCVAGLLAVTAERIHGHEIFELANGEWALRRVGDVWPCGHGPRRKTVIRMAMECESNPNERHPIRLKVRAKARGLRLRVHSPKTSRSRMRLRVRSNKRNS